MRRMADQWVIAYDIDNPAADAAGDVTKMTIYNRVRRCRADHGFSNFTQLSVYSMDDGDNALVRVYQALHALSLLNERQYIKRLHVFKIDGALNDVLPIVADRPSAPAPSQGD